MSHVSSGTCTAPRRRARSAYACCTLSLSRRFSSVGWFKPSTSAGTWLHESSTVALPYDGADRVHGGHDVRARRPVQQPAPDGGGLFRAELHLHPVIPLATDQGRDHGPVGLDRWPLRVPDPQVPAIPPVPPGPSRPRPSSLRRPRNAPRSV